MSRREELQTTAERKKRMVVSLRWVLILASSSLILFNAKRTAIEDAHLIVALLLGSNFLLMQLPSRLFVRKLFDSLLVCADVTIVSGSIYLTGQVNSDFFLLYFLVIMTSALSETPRALLWSAGAICAVYLLMVERLYGIDALLSTDVLIRIPFFFIVSFFYGHLTQRVRREQKEKKSLQRRLSQATRVRRYSRFFSGALSRRAVLKGLVKAERRLCRSRSVIVFSRRAKRILAQSSDRFIGDEEFENLLAGINGAIREFDVDFLEESLSPRLIRKGATVRGAGFTLIPMTGKLDSDLYIAIEGNLAPGILEHAKLLLFNAALALKNAGQYQALLHEVEKRKELSQELFSALESKSGFVANVSHELRTPVNALIGFGELLVEGGYGALSEEVEGVLKRMLQNANSLRELINHILDFSKLEAGAMTVRRELGNTRLFLDDLLETSSALIRDKSLSLIGHSDEVELELDWKLLRQIGLNLLSNAIKFTPEGEVRVSLRYNEGEGGVLFEVQDTGIGMNEAELAIIFEPFKQVDNTYTKRFAGTGLGLSITKRQVELLGGEISVESKVGQGSCFRVHIPFVSTPKKQSNPNNVSELDSQVSPA